MLAPEPQHTMRAPKKMMNPHANLVTEILPVSDEKSQQIGIETEKDACLERVIKNLNHVGLEVDVGNTII